MALFGCKGFNSLWNGLPTPIWAGLITLVVIELVLGIDNLVFIAILAENSLRHSVTARASPACC
jgi:predicted tellurium resistance membrane protein TerC